MSNPTGNVNRNELFVRSIPLDVTSEKLTEFFSDFAPVKHAVVVMDKETAQSKGFGFVSFATPEDAELAKKEGSGRTMSGGRKLIIDIAKPRQRNDKSPVNVEAEAEREKRRPRLLIRNCPWSLRDPQELVKLFSRYGKVENAYIPRGANNKMSGFAFVTMRRKKHAKRAIEESKDLKIHGRAVNVSLALEKSKWVNRDESTQINLDDSSDSESESEKEDDEFGGIRINQDDLESESDGENDEELDQDEIPLSDEDDEEANDDENSEDEDAEENDLENQEDDDNSEDAGEKSTPKKSSNKNTVFVRNVPYDATSDSLRKHFETHFGPVFYALPVMDKEKNYPKGTAFVAFRFYSDLENCADNAPEVSTSSLLLPDDVDSRYVYEGRVLNVTRAVQRDTADRLASKRADERRAALGKAPKVQDKRRTFLLNEGRINPDSKLAELIPKAEMEIRDKSFKLRRQQLAKNPSLHLSMTRLAIRNLPRSMDEKALKALGRKAVVSFATEVQAQQRQPLSKEEIMRSVTYQDSLGDSANSKKHGVVKQAKIIQEVKGSGSAGRSRGYGFLEMKNHKAALMALRWLNAHKVTKEEIAQGNEGNVEAEKPRRLVVEFAIENAQVVKRQRERQYRAKEKGLKRKMHEIEAEKKREEEEAEPEEPKKRGNAAIGRKRKSKRVKS